MEKWLWPDMLRREKGSNISNCSTDNDFARSFYATKQLWRRKISKAIGHFGDQGVEVYQILLRRVWRGRRRRVFVSKYDRLHVGITTAFNKFYIDSLDKIWGIGQSGRMAYVASISDLLEYRKFCSKFCCHRGLRKKSPKVFGQRYEIKLDDRFGYRDTRIW